MSLHVSQKQNGNFFERLLENCRTITVLTQQSNSRIYYATCIRRPEGWRWSIRNIGTQFGWYKTRVIGLLDGKRILTTYSAVLVQYQIVTDGQMDGRTDTLRHVTASPVKLLKNRFNVISQIRLQRLLAVAWTQRPN